MVSVNKLIVGLAVVFFMTSSAVSGQGIKAFTPDSVKYLAEVTSMFYAVDKKKYKPFVDEFTAVWYSGKISESLRDKVYKTSNAMLDRRMRLPEFKPYLFSLMSFVQSNRSEEDFNAWQESLDKLIAGRKKSKFVDYVKISSNLFENNVLYESASTTWKSSTDDYQFVYDSLPKIIFPRLNLKCYAKRDSSVIYDTKGVYYPTLGRWEGGSGKVTWERVGIDATETYAVFESYDFKIKSSSYVIDSVLFFNSFFAQPLKGKITEKILAKTGEKATYPRFESFEKRLTIPNLIEGVDYDGGFTMHGARLLGSGSKEELASLIFYRENEPFMVSKALNYSISPDRISSPRSAITFFLDEDSITHPALNLKFIKKDRLLTLVRDEEISKSPFFNSFHNVDMYFEALYWKLDDPIIEMGALFGSTNKVASFQSINYYQEAVYEAKLRYDAVHPLIRLKDLSKKMDSRQFYAIELAKEMRITKPELIPLLLELSGDGFITYDSESEFISIKDKTFEYILARAGKIDYDVITFDSEITGDKSNAVLNLLNYDLLIRGIQRVNLSDSQSVAAFPADKNITLKKNRDFTFLGASVAGKSIFYGKEFSFQYDEFKLNLINVDSMAIRANIPGEFNRDGEPLTRRVRSVLEGIRGHIDIDNPFNKSGLQNKEYPTYPIVTTTKKSYVFYDKSSIHGGVYNRDNFYFQVEPFVMDSLDNYPNSSIGFDGTFVSAGIFPEFEETLTLQEDYSLGFIRNTPTDGFGLYADKGEYNNEIRLDHKGLMGDGVIDFLTSTSTSEAFTFFPDSISGMAHFINKEKEGSKVSFPEVDGEDVRILYVPKKEALLARKVSSDIKFFGGEATLDGALVLRPKGMIGRGKMDFEKATLTSKVFEYGSKTIDSDTAAFKLNSEDLGGLAFKTDNVNAHVDFSERKGVFKSNSDDTYVEFPVNEYICYMDRFNWYMDQDEIELEASENTTARADIEINQELDLAKSNFFSVKEGQDSLNFMAPKARYDLNTNVINCADVPFIKVADAQVQPDSGKVVIRKKARMDPLENSSILANFTTKYHNIYNATVNVHTRTSYDGSGDYDYVDENKNVQTIKFSNINVDTTLQTYANGKVLEQDQFMLSPSFEYKGEVQLKASEKFLTFTGGTRIVHDCPGVAKNWMNFTTEIDPNEIYIPISGELKNADGQPIGAGLVMNADSISLYSTFLSLKRDAAHLDVATANGFLRFDKKSREYQISNKDKLKERSLPGNFISLNTESCELGGDGRFDFAVNLGLLKAEPIGGLTHNMASGEISMNTTLSLDFFFNDQALDRMAEVINKYPDLEGVDISKTKYEAALREIIGLEKADKAISELSLNGNIKKFPDQLEVSMFIADVKFKWNPESKSYQSVGKIGIANTNKRQIFRYVKGHIEVKKNRATKGSDEIGIYLELDASNWFYFTYYKDIFQAISSDKEFNTIIKETKEDKAKYKEGKQNFKFMLSTASKKSQFLKRFDSL